MAAITFDTLAYSEKMQKAGFTREQADAILWTGNEISCPQWRFCFAKTPVKLPQGELASL